MKLHIVNNYAAMSARALVYLQQVLGASPQPVISFTTGGTPAGLFGLMVEAINHKKMDITHAIFLNLDEYVGPRDAVYTVHTFMQQHLYNHITDRPAFSDMFTADAPDKEAEIARYCRTLARYPRDIQLLGLGINGHIGANEPGTPFDATAFCARHTASTIQSTVDLYQIRREDAPEEMFTLGFTEIMAARLPLLCASGKSKAQAVKQMLEGPVDTACPASLLRTHPGAVFILDEDAASLLQAGTRKWAEQ